MLSIRRNNMTLSNAEQTQKDNFGPTKEFVHRLTITPLDTIWVATLEGSTEKRIVGYTDNNNTGVRRLDIILIPGEYLMITRNEKRSIIAHTSKVVFKINNKSVEEATNYPRDTLFRKLDLTESYCNDINLRFLFHVIGEENLVHFQPWHRPMSFLVRDNVNSNAFKGGIVYRLNGDSRELVRPSEWTKEWDEDDHSVYAVVPFINVSSIVFIMQDNSKHRKWANELINELEEEGIFITTEYKDIKLDQEITPSIYRIEYPLPEQLFNVK